MYVKRLIFLAFVKPLDGAKENCKNSGSSIKNVEDDRGGRSGKENTVYVAKEKSPVAGLIAGRIR
ncbi:MAG: hypothetical protein OXI53_01100 [Nitrospira sp.]|nr:hypothetical protein [Nitrospira sp.]